MADQEDFRELFERALDGDRDAQAELYLEYGKHMRRWIRIRLRRLKIAWAVEADDVFDSFFTRIIEGRVTARFKGPLHFVRYCEKSLRNSCRHALRSSILRTANSVADCPIELFEDANAVEEVESVTWREQLEYAYSQLTHLERVISFFRAGGHRWEEIGERLGKSADAVRMMHRRAEGRVRSELLWGETEQEQDLGHDYDSQSLVIHQDAVSET